MLLDDEGRIIAVDQKAAHMLGKSVNAEWFSIKLRDFEDNSDSSRSQESEGIGRGLASRTLKLPQGERLDVETYNVACHVKPQCVPLIFGHTHFPPVIPSKTNFC